MNTTAIFNNLMNFYREHSATTNYILGYHFDGVIYMTVTNDDVLPMVVGLTKASRGNGYRLRYKPTTAQRKALMNINANAICSVEVFNQMVEESKYNKGEVFEKIVTEMFGQKWEKDSVPFYEDGDLTVNGIKYQIKYENASLINEKQMIRMIERA